MRKLLLLLLLFACHVPGLFAWGGYEHTVIAYIAQDHLSETALSNIRYYLDQPIYEYAEWMDYIPMHNYPGYDLMKNGHCSVVWSDGSIADTVAVENGEGNGYAALMKSISVMKNHRDYPDSVVVLHLRYFIHMIGDFHCPGHVIFLDKPADSKTAPVSEWKDNRCWKKVYYKTSANKKTIHWLWDAALQNLHKDWSYDRWREELDTWPLDRREEACKGSVKDWLLVNAVSARRIFDFSKEGETYDESYYTGEALEICYTQLRLASYRMAGILNDCFGHEK